MLEVSKKALAAVAATDSEDDRTLTVDVHRASKVVVNINMATRHSATKLEAIVKRSVDDGASYAKLHTVAISAGTGTLSEYDPEKTLLEAGVDPLPSISLDLDVAAVTHLKVTGVATDGSSSDTFTITAGLACWS
jgi:hypothetical protein